MSEYQPTPPPQREKPIFEQAVQALSFVFALLVSFLFAPYIAAVFAVLIGVVLPSFYGDMSGSTPTLALFLAYIITFLVAFLSFQSLILKSLIKRLSK